MASPISGQSAQATVPGAGGVNTAGGDGVHGISDNGTAVHGESVAGFGVLGESKTGRGVVARSDSDYGLRASSRVSAGIRGSSEQGRGVEGWAVASEGVVGISTSGTGVWGQTQSAGTGVAGTSTQGPGVHGVSVDGRGVQGESATNYGVSGDSQRSAGVRGTSVKGRGTEGWSTHSEGVVGLSRNGTGVWGQTPSGGDGVLGTSEQGVGVHGRGGRLAGLFEGDVEVTGDIILSNADCAEDFDILDGAGAEPGTVMVLGDDGGALSESQRPYDKRVAGVVSGAGDFQPALVLDRQAGRAGRRPIALMGKVFCKADARYGAIEVGDLLTTSASPGHAMKAAEPLQAFGAVIGKALRPLAEGQGLIPILIALQ